MTSNLTGWVEPTQRRSREKVARILDTAIRLAQRNGSLDLKMTEVALEAGVAIGTLYQFFPSRTALIARLFAREMEPVDAGLSTVFDTPDATASLTDRIRQQLNMHLNMVRARPGLRLIWGAASIDPAIESADLENSRRNARSLYTQWRNRSPSGAVDGMQATCLLICHLWGSVMRLCMLTDEDEAGQILTQYARMIAAQVRRLERQD